jgi:hypothetical protein
MGAHRDGSNTKGASGEPHRGLQWRWGDADRVGDEIEEMWQFRLCRHGEWGTERWHRSMERRRGMKGVPTMPFIGVGRRWWGGETASRVAVVCYKRRLVMEGDWRGLTLSEEGK